MTHSTIHGAKVELAQPQQQVMKLATSSDGNTADTESETYGMSDIYDS